MIPEVGKEYHIFDDGKIKPSRHFIAKILEVIPFEDCKDEKLINAWQEIVEEDKELIGLFAEQTDYFVKAESDFDEYPLYFVRTSNDCWFSIDYPTAWMGARLDIDGSLYKIMVDYYGEDDKVCQN